MSYAGQQIDRVMLQEDQTNGQMVTSFLLMADGKVRAVTLICAGRD
jgi:hypothetical protein